MNGIVAVPDGAPSAALWAAHVTRARAGGTNVLSVAPHERLQNQDEEGPLRAGGAECAGSGAGL